jgi:hypothetical protein
MPLQRGDIYFVNLSPVMVANKLAGGQSSFSPLTPSSGCRWS